MQHEQGDWELKTIDIMMSAICRGQNSISIGGADYYRTRERFELPRTG
jgi:hypothetical protein